MGPHYKLGNRDIDPIDPFTRAVNINSQLDLPRDTPLVDCLAGAMTFGHLLDLVEKYHRT